MKLMAHELRQARTTQAERESMTRDCRSNIDDVLWRVTLVREAMEAAGMRQADLANYLGISIVQVNRWLHGVRTVPDRWLKPLADLLEGNAAMEAVA